MGLSSLMPTSPVRGSEWADSVKAGQVVAVDGNNGAAEAPHVHVGAFRGRVPFQVRWDQRAEGKLPSFQ